MRKSPRRLISAGLAAVLTSVMLVVLTPGVGHAELCDTHSLWLGPPTGSYVCNYQPTPVLWPDGHLQWFIVGNYPPGSDQYPVYDSYQVAPYGTFTAWRNLGGNARSAVFATATDDGGLIVLYVTGTTGCRYFKYWETGQGWTPSQAGWSLQTGTAGC